MVNRGYDDLRSEPRFATVLRRLNLDVAQFTLPDANVAAVNHFIEARFARNY